MLAPLARRLQQRQIQIAATQKATQLPVNQEVVSITLSISRTAVSR